MPAVIRLVSGDRARALPLILVIASLIATIPPVRAQTPSYPLKLSADGKYLVDQGNRPFFVNGDTAWSLIAELSREDADVYLENRKQKGFNLIIASLIEHQFSARPPANFYGQRPFNTTGDFTTPNEAY